MDKEKRRIAAMSCASLLGFEPGAFTLMELGKGFGLFSVGGVEYLAVKGCEVVFDGAPSQEGFAAMAAAAGLPKKIGYSTSEVARATGLSCSAISRSAASGKLRSYLPNGLKRGRLMTPEMVDEWMKGGN